MDNYRIRKLTKNALLISIVIVSAKVINIPTPIGGVINISDSIILCISLLLSTQEAVLISSSGAFIAEVFSPYAIFAPATLLIKGCVAFISSTLNKRFNKDLKTTLIILIFLFAESFMILGYLIFQAYFLGLGLAVASLDLVNNLIQAGASTIIGFLLYKALSSNKSIIKLFI